ncbi:MAG: putative RNA-binding protein YlqC (UPF0109 family) [Bradymonadia bacterium]|jgi:predicted RNA-binding protein YlqC (UPF0109 family)
MAKEHTYTEALAEVIRPLLSQPESLEVFEARNKNAVALEFVVEQSDAGRVIGKGGATIRAIRETIQFAGSKNDDRLSVELRDAD